MATSPDSDSEVRTVVAETLRTIVSAIDESMDCKWTDPGPVLLCVVCKSRFSKYRCPKCSTRSCSLHCVRKHKRESGCDGIRDRTAYVSIANFSDLDLLSDYRLLEETARCVSNASRNPATVVNRRMYVGDPRSAYSRPRLPYYQYRLVVECRKRRTTLQIMPDIFKRRRENTTHFRADEKKFYWHIVWEFPQANASYADDEVAEDCLLETAVEKYLCPTAEYAATTTGDVTVSQRLAFYQSAGYKGVVPLMKIERVQTALPRYMELDYSETVAWNLEGKTIIEFPTILLVLREHLHCYSILEDDDDEEDQEEAPRVEARVKVGDNHRELSEGECSSSSS